MAENNEAPILKRWKSEQEIGEKRKQKGFNPHKPKRYYKFVENITWGLEEYPKYGDECTVLRNGESFWVKVIKNFGSEYIVQVKNNLLCNDFLKDDLIVINRRFLFCKR